MQQQDSNCVTSSNRCQAWQLLRGTVPRLQTIQMAYDFPNPHPKILHEITVQETGMGKSRLTLITESLNLI